MDELQRQDSARWIDPLFGAQISCHEITWSNSRGADSIQTGGGLYFHTLPPGGTYPHTHDFAEILLVTGGGLLHRVNGERQLLAAGHLAFIRPDDTHCFAPDGKHGKCELTLLDFQLELFLTLSRYLEDDSFLKQFTEPVLPPTFKLNETDAAALGDRMIRLNSENINLNLRKVKLKILLAELFAKYFIDESTRLTEAQVPDWVEQLCVEMRKVENFSVGIKRMQKLACRTPEHLCKSFRRYLGKTPTAFVNDLRMSHAARQLADTGTDIVEIAASLHFKSLSRFYLLFRERYGLTPVQYRKRHAAGSHLPRRGRE